MSGVSACRGIKDMKKHYKTILIWIGGITLGGVISYFMGLAVQSILGKQKISYTLDIGNNWWLVSGIFILMFGLVVAGFFLGRKLENI
jgi:purine-cytosine permease-like protein